MIRIPCLVPALFLMALLIPSLASASGDGDGGPLCNADIASGCVQFVNLGCDPEITTVAQCEQDACSGLDELRSEFGEECVSAIEDFFACLVDQTLECDPSDDDVLVPPDCKDEELRVESVCGGTID